MDDLVLKARTKISENLRDSRKRSRLTQERMQERTGITNYSRIENGMSTTMGRLARVLEEFDAQRTLLKIADPTADKDGQNLEQSKTRAVIQAMGDDWKPGQFGDELVIAVRAWRVKRNVSAPTIPKRVEGDPATSNRTPPLKPLTEGILEQLGLQLEVARIRRGYTAREFVERAARRGKKLSRNTLARLEAGDPRATVEQLLLVLEMLNLIETAETVGSFETAMNILLAAQEAPPKRQRYRAPTKNATEFDF